MAKKTYTITKNPVLPPPQGTLAEAQARLLDHLYPPGAECPCCGRYTRLYQYTLSPRNCLFLVLLYRQHPNYVHIDSMPEKVIKSRDWNRLTYWGLIEEAPADDPDKQPRSGRWRLTEEGRAFVELRASIRKYATVYYDQVLGFDGPNVTIDDFDDENFNYAAHMARPYALP